MTPNRLGFRPALLATVALGSMFGCENPVKTGPVNDVVFFGRTAGSYEVCFFVQEDFTSLQPSTACDRNGATPYSFNIEVTSGSDQDGEPCAFDLRVDEPIPIDEEGSFAFTQTDPDDPTVTRRLSGQINVDSGFDSAAGTAEEEVITLPEPTLCEVTWNASSGPVCREVDFARCQLLADCCDSIYLVPPSMNECQLVVDACDPDACDALLAGYLDCPQPPICPLPDDPARVCTQLQECCLDVAPLTKEEIQQCVAIAEQCNPITCLLELDEYPECQTDE